MQGQGDVSAVAGHAGECQSAGVPVASRQCARPPYPAAPARMQSVPNVVFRWAGTSNCTSFVLKAGSRSCVVDLMVRPPGRLILVKIALWTWVGSACMFPLPTKRKKVNCTIHSATPNVASLLYDSMRLPCKRTSVRPNTRYACTK